MKKRDLFPMNEMDLKSIKSLFFFLSIESFRILEMLFDSLNVYLQHMNTLIVRTGTKNDS